MIKHWLTIGLAVAGLAVGWQMGLHRDAKSDISEQPADAQRLPATYWDNLDGGKNQLGEWQGNVLIVNHWATWCEPCRREIPMFMAVHEHYAEQGVELIGLAHDDEDEVRRYVDSMGMDYPQLLAGIGQGQKWLVNLGGNGSLPLTLVYDREGNLRAKKLGLMSESELHQAVESVL